MTNSTSNFGRILREICEQEQIRLIPYADEWAWELQRGDRSEFIFGYQFGLNKAVVQSICKDKAMTSEVLAAHGIPCVPHSCFMPPKKAFYVGGDGSWERASRLLQTYGQIVCKDNEGTGGDQVYLVRTQQELEQAAAALFAVGCSMCICPWRKINREYRVIVLDGAAELIFEKERAALTGDGTHTLRELYREYLADPQHEARSVPAAALNRVLPPGEQYYFEWKHNLGRGADVRFCEEEPEPVRALAMRAAKTIGARFVSVDVIESEGRLEVLEINGGVMMEHFSHKDAGCYERAKAIYRKAIQKMFA